MFSAVRMVGGSPIAVSRYGPVRVRPSTSSAPLGPSTNQLDATTRTLCPSPPSSCSASAPASRSSSTASSMTAAFGPWLPGRNRTSIPGPRAGSVPARMPRSRARLAAASRAADRPALPAASCCWVVCSWLISWLSRSLRASRSDRMRTRSSGRAVVCAWSVAWLRSCTTKANPNSTSSRPIAAPAADTRRRPAGDPAAASPTSGSVAASGPSTSHSCGCAAAGFADGFSAAFPGGAAAGISGGASVGAGQPVPVSWCGSLMTYYLSPEEPPADTRHIAEDPYPEHDHDAGGQLGTHAELVAEEHDQPGDQDVGDERHDELLVVEDAVQLRPDPAEHRVQRGDHGDRQVRLEGERYRRFEEGTEPHSDHQCEYREHQRPPGDDGTGEPGEPDTGVDGLSVGTGWA